MCLLSHALYGVDVINMSILGEDAPFTKAIREAGFEEEAYPSLHADADTLLYLGARSGKHSLFTHPSFEKAQRYLQQNPSIVGDALFGAIVGVSAARSWAIFFGNATNLLLIPNSADPRPMYWGVMAAILLPEVFNNARVMHTLHTRNPHTSLCEGRLTPSHKAMNVLNYTLCTLFLAKYFKVYYTAAWGDKLSHGERRSADWDYFFVLCYLWSNWWKKHAILDHKIHIIKDKFFATEQDEHHDRHVIQKRLADSYRKLQQGSDVRMLTFATKVTNINHHADSIEKQQKATLALLAYLYHYGHKHEEISKSQRQDKPDSLKAAEFMGRVAGTLLMPASTLGAYYAMDSILSLVGLREEHYHHDDHDMQDPLAWTYAIITSLYSGFAGYHAGPDFARHLWCRHHGKDPNLYTDHLSYWPQNFRGIRAVMGGGTSYLISSFLMLPIAELLAKQVHVLGGPLSLRKALLLTTAQWGIIMDTSFVGPQYQNLIGYLGRAAGGDKLGTIKDHSLKMIVNLHQGIERLDDEKITMLKKALDAWVPDNAEAPPTSENPHTPLAPEPSPLAETWIGSKPAEDTDSIHAPLLSGDDEAESEASEFSGDDLDEEYNPRPRRSSSVSSRIYEQIYGRAYGFWQKTYHWFLGRPVPTRLANRVRHIMKDPHAPDNESTE